MKKNKYIFKIVLSALFLALAYVMPFLTGQIPEIGSMLCPIHIPVILCGFICGWKWGLIVGFIAPLFRSLTISLPPLFPSAVCMAFEIATYGALSGLLYNLLPKKKIFIYISLILSMIVGRIVWGIFMLLCLNINGGSFTFTAFISGAITNALPGIILQIVLIPIIIIVYEKLTEPTNDK